MVIKKGKMVIELEEDIEKLNLEIEELLKVKEMLINSSAYKLLYGKTQTIGTKEPKPIRGRLEHSQNVSTISQRRIAQIYDECATQEQKETLEFEANRMKAILYVDICSLAHDLGHTPYGHNGERSINKFIQNIKDKEQIEQIIQRRIECFGIEYEEQQGHIGDEVVLSFEHNEQSALTFYDLLKNSDINLELIDVKRMINAILSHSTTRVTKCPDDLVAQVIRLEDKEEYREMDYHELGRYIKPINDSNSKENATKSIIEEAIEKGRIDDDMEKIKELKEFRKKYEDAIYFLHEGRKGLLTSENIERNRVIVSKLLNYYYENPDKICDKELYTVTAINSNVDEEIRTVYNGISNRELTRVERVINYILSMDNMKAERQYLKLVKQRILTGKGIEPVTEEELQEIRNEQEEEKVEQMLAKEYGRTAQPHTREEIRNIVRSRDARFMRERLTKEGCRVIAETIKLIDAENRIDSQLYEQMDFADTARKHRSTRKQIRERAVDRVIGNRNDEENRLQLAGVEAKKRWQYIEGATGENISEEARRMIEERRTGNQWRKNYTGAGSEDIEK